MAKILFNEDLFDKVYLLEFSQNDYTRYFGFSVPPQNEEFTLSQRIGETKTFGGLIIDDYGSDVERISLSGSTINNSVRRLLISKESTEELSGEEELFLLKDIIEEFGKRDRLENKSITLYNLSSEKVWNVVINEFRITRSKDNPLVYNYTISFTSDNRDSVKNLQSIKAGVKNIQDKIKVDLLRQSVDAAQQRAKTTLNGDSNWFTKVKNFCKNIQKKSNELLSEIKKAYGDYNKMIQKPKDIILTIVQDCENLETMVDEWATTIEGFADITLDTARDTITAFEDAFNAPLRLVFNKGHDIYHYGLELSKKIKDVCDIFADMFIPDENGKIGLTSNFQASYLEQFSETTEEIGSFWQLFIDEYQSSGNTIGTLCKDSNSLANNYGLIPGSFGEDDSIVIFNGEKSYIVKHSDTWDSIAENNIGEASYANLIATYNGLTTDVNHDKNIIDLPIGVEIKIPIIQKIKSTKINDIYMSLGQYDSLGKDLRLDDKGNFVVENQDIMSIGGVDNLNQAISNRLSTALDSRIRLGLYGIRSNIGGTRYANAFLKTSIEKTILADKRVKNINKINYKGLNDGIQIKVIYSDISNNQQLYEGV